MIQNVPEQQVPGPVVAPPPLERKAPQEVDTVAPVEAPEARVSKPNLPPVTVQKKSVRSKAKRTRAVSAKASGKQPDGSPKAQWKPDVIHVGLAGALLLCAVIALISRKKTQETQG
jgi:hypothetical protein